MPPVPSTPKISKACAPCRARKIKCNAAVVGLPCGSCVSRECPHECVLSARKPRTVQSDHANDSIVASHMASSGVHTSPVLPNYPPPRQTQPDLLYLNILQDTVDKSATGQGIADDSNSNGGHDSFDNQLRRWNPPLELDDIDNEYLTKKKVFELPSQQYMDAIVKAYFEHVHPFAPIINRGKFIEDYRSGSCSLFLLHAMSTAASLYLPIEVIQGYAFVRMDRINFTGEYGGSLMSAQPTPWFARSSIDILKNKDIFHFLINTQNLRLLANAPPIKPLTEDDWEVEDTVSDFLSPIVRYQKASLIAHCELAQIFTQLISVITNGASQDLPNLIQPLDSWRMLLPGKMQLGNPPPESEIFVLEALTTSYRFECIMCRLLGRGRWNVQDANVHQWAQQRFRSAILELDTIVKRVLINNKIRQLPTNFITTITALLALHIESALDSSQSSLIRSMARISIQHTMLALGEIEDIPAVKRALPAFEMVLSKNKLQVSSLRDIGHSNLIPDNSLHDDHVPQSTRSDMTLDQGGNNDQLFTNSEFSGLELFNQWQMEQLDFAGIY
ncbi:cutinase transcription factor 1 beta [Fusarium heterosporum]|uniref:Cutinase transcription factor 1 beta n=1 Tax=Fusarium heterosporum TaxID=42747 RepID=A0A8H5WW05_FUSHE|nr:cutinase transcription factor 1 beta [Fusarium heterosporum]